MATYRTIRTESVGEFKDRGSKFIGYLIPVDEEDDIKPQIERLRKQHHKARHVCSAFRLRADGSFARSNDDGEPANSAGEPILRQLKSARLTFCLAAVVRYFGGTLLGVSGLINAYKTATEYAVAAADIVEDYERARLRLSVPYENLNDVMQFIKAQDLEILEQYFDVDCSFKLRFPLEDQLYVRERLTDMTNVTLLT